MISTIAIDPGSASSAAVAGIDSDGLLHVAWKFGTLRDVAVAVSGLIAEIKPGRQVIEFVHAMPGQGVTSMFTFGRGTGAGFGALFALRPACPVYEVTPQAWQKWYARATFDSTEVAPEVFSARELEQCRQPRGKLNHNACDAALIAYWAANQTEEEMQARISEHWRPPCKPSRKPRTGTARK